MALTILIGFKHSKIFSVIINFGNISLVISLSLLPLKENLLKNLTLVSKNGTVIIIKLSLDLPIPLYLPLIAFFSDLILQR
ncbi:unnamed protein product [Coffea canephora]|uniref:Uncharacterized protein n=1 Tax=Coffea canephora TaxID=49390 RepID=A0A068VCZ7_COFCA|nr:unnamed protein product [Coffea canephora]